MKKLKRKIVIEKNPHPMIDWVADYIVNPLCTIIVIMFVIALIVYTTKAKAYVVSEFGGFQIIRERHDALHFDGVSTTNITPFPIKKHVVHDTMIFAKKFEGYSSCAYPDLGGGYSIGYGTVSKKKECIKRSTAEKRLEYVLGFAFDIIPMDLRTYSRNSLVVLTDVIYNVRPQNYEYVFNAFRTGEQEEIIYALSTLQYAKGVKYGGLVNRFNARKSLIFNK